MHRPLITVIGTGGTIAGAPSGSGSPLEYKAGALSVDALFATVHGLGERFRLRHEQVADIGSEDMTDGVWLRLLAAAARHAGDDGVAGLVIVHGTDTMEETAYFLSLALNTAKPVILTGAMRPPHAPGADGPANLHDAVCLAGSPGAAGKGALVVMNGRVHSARDVTKTDTLAVDAFHSPGHGPLGRMLEGRPLPLRTPAEAHTTASRFAGTMPAALPRVDIVYGHAGQRRDAVDAAVAAGAEGIVHAGAGMGSVHRDVLPALIEAVRKGVSVACSSRVGAGPVPRRESLRRDGFVAASDLNPQKARVLLQLALTLTRDADGLQEIFDTH